MSGNPEISIREEEKPTDPISTATRVESLACKVNPIAAQFGLAVHHLGPAARRVVGRTSPHRAAAAQLLAVVVGGVAAAAGVVALLRVYCAVAADLEEHVHGLLAAA